MIDPQGPLPLAGYQKRDTLVAPPAKHTLQANWIAQQSGQGLCILLAVDALFSSVTFETMLRDALAVAGHSVAHLTVVASHSHFAPQLDDTKPKLGQASQEHMQQVARLIAQDISDATAGADIPVATVAHSAAPVQGSIFRRRAGIRILKKPPFMRRETIMAPAPWVDIPRHLRLWIFYSDAGDALASIASWPCHPVSRSDHDRISADYVAAIRSELRRAFHADLPVLFLPGCSGDIRPDFRRTRLRQRIISTTPFQQGFARATQARQDAFDDTVAQATRNAIATLTTTVATQSGRWQHTSIDLDVDGASSRLPVAAITLGPLQIFAIGAEPAMGWTKKLGMDATSPTTVLTGYAGAVFGYLPLPEQVAQGGYEVSGFGDAFDFAGRFKARSDIADTLASAIAALQPDPPA